MNIMLLAAGKGERMLPLTAKCPKPLLCANGKPLLEHWLDKLEKIQRKHGCIGDVIVNAAYLGEQIEHYIGSRESLLSIIVSREEVPLETGGGIVRALPLLGEKPFLLINGDVFCDFDLSPWLIRSTVACDTFFGEKSLSYGENSFGHLLMVENPAHNPLGDFLVNAKQRVHTRLHSESGYTFAGISVFSPELITQYPHCREHFPLREVFDWAMSAKKLSAEIHQGFWLDVGTPERLAYLDKYLQSNAIKN